MGAALSVAGRLAVILVLALATIEGSDFALKRMFDRISARAEEPRRAAQLRTLAPLTSAIVRTLVIVVAAMMLLSEFGVEVGPLIAGAGIIGLAVGFGAQTLVKDFLTGFFLIIEDSVSIGDVAKINDTSGTVEEMTLRTIKLRQFDGTLSVFPYSEAQIIHNMTKLFSFYVFDLSIAYSADIQKALDVVKQTGDALQNDPEFKQFILAPIEIFGVDSLADSAVMLKARFKTTPIKQWSVGREYLKRIKLAFDAAGVEIPFPHLKLVAPDEAIATSSTKPDGA
jgi:small conductance mechanosensitive channel